MQAAMAVWVTILRFMGDLPEPNFTSGVGDVKVRVTYFNESDIFWSEFTWNMYFDWEWLVYKGACVGTGERILLFAVHLT